MGPFVGGDDVNIDGGARGVRKGCFFSQLEKWAGRSTYADPGMLECLVGGDPFGRVDR